MPNKQTAGIDGRNRHIEQEAQTDTDLETVVPPTSPFGGPTTWWRIGAAVIALAIIAFALFQAF
jgi:hypothetical protein